MHMLATCSLLYVVFLFPARLEESKRGNGAEADPEAAAATISRYRFPRDGERGGGFFFRGRGLPIWAGEQASLGLGEAPGGPRRLLVDAPASHRHRLRSDTFPGLAL